MKLLPPLRVASRKKSGRSMPLDVEKHESRIQHYLDLANVALTTKKKSEPIPSEEQRVGLSKMRTNRRA
jgi:hypothetical protein